MCSCPMCYKPLIGDLAYQCLNCGYTYQGSYEEYKRIKKSGDICPQTKQRCQFLFQYDGGSMPVRTNLICKQQGNFIFNLIKPIPFEICNLAASYLISHINDKFKMTVQSASARLSETDN